MSNRTRDPRRRTATSVAAGLRLWAEGHDAHVRAAVELLIRHGGWLRRMDLHAAALHRDPDGTYWIDWTALRREFDAGRYDHTPPAGAGGDRPRSRDGRGPLPALADGHRQIADRPDNHCPDPAASPADALTPGVTP